jgi:Tfp pilus assembly protein PilO
MKFKPIYLWAFLPALIVIGWAIAFYVPVSSTNLLKEREVTVIKANRLAMENEINGLKALRKKEGEITFRIDSISAGIPRYEDLPGFMKEIAKTARGNGVFIEDFGSVFSSLEAGRAKPVTNPSFEITVKGRFRQIGGFLEEVVNNKAFKGIQKMALSYEDKQYPVLTGKFVMEFKARRD